MLNHTLIKGPETAPDCLYKVHQFVARAMQEATRDYLYSYDAQGNEIYLRTESPRSFRADVSVLQPWEPMASIEDGGSYVVDGVLYLDRSPSRFKWRDRAFDAKYRMARASKQDVCSAKIDDKNTDRIVSRLSTFLKLTECDLQLLPSELLGKPGMGRVAMTPIHVRATGTVHNAQEAERAQRDGVGRGKAFGFGVLHFISHQ